MGVCVCVFLCNMPVFACLCTWVCVHHVGQDWIWGAEAELGGWHRAEGLGWLACDYSGCWVFTERWGGGRGGTETAAFTLYCKLHTHMHTNAHTRHKHLQKAGAPVETPQALQCVCVCLCYSWPAGTSGSEWQPYTHHSPTTAEHGAGWVGERFVDAGWPGQPCLIDFFSLLLA